MVLERGLTLDIWRKTEFSFGLRIPFLSIIWDKVISVSSTCPLGLRLCVDTSSEMGRPCLRVSGESHDSAPGRGAGPPLGRGAKSEGLWVPPTWCHITTPWQIRHCLSHLNYDTLRIASHNLMFRCVETRKSHVLYTRFRVAFLGQGTLQREPGGSALLCGCRGALGHLKCQCPWGKGCALLIPKTPVFTASHVDPAALAPNTCA